MPIIIADVHVGVAICPLLLCEGIISSASYVTCPTIPPLVCPPPNPLTPFQYPVVSTTTTVDSRLRWWALLLAAAHARRLSDGRLNQRTVHRDARLVHPLSPQNKPPILGALLSMFGIGTAGVPDGLLRGAWSWRAADGMVIHCVWQGTILRLRNASFSREPGVVLARCMGRSSLIV